MHIAIAATVTKVASHHIKFQVPYRKSGPPAGEDTSKPSTSAKCAQLGASSRGSIVMLNVDKDDDKYTLDAVLTQSGAVLQQ